MAVEPTRRGEGIGHGLIRRSMAMATLAGHRIVLLVGDMAYYGQFGIEPAAPLGLDMPDEAPHRLLVATLATDGLNRVIGSIARPPVAQSAADVPCLDARLPG